MSNEGTYISSAESKINKIGLSFTLKNISRTGATLVFTQGNEGTPTGELEYGDDYTLEIQKNGKWEQAPIVLEGDYGFNSIAYIIPSKAASERELKWEWLYGALSTGDYRIVKSILDFRGPGNFDKYTISAQFRLN